MSRKDELDMLIWDTIIQGMTATITNKNNPLLVDGKFDNRDTQYLKTRFNLISSWPPKLYPSIQFVLDYALLFAKLDNPSYCSKIRDVHYEVDLYDSFYGMNHGDDRDRRNANVCGNCGIGLNGNDDI
jgi:hypothetical protein